MIKYLLGELSEAEQQRIEDQYFRDIEFFDQLLIAEDELIDAYVNSELSGDRLNRFEYYFLQSPERREKVAFAEAWQAFIAKQSEFIPDLQISPPPQSIFKQLSFLLPTTAALIVSISAIWLFVDRINLNGELDRAHMAIARIEERQQSVEDEMIRQKSRNEELLRKLEASPNSSTIDKRTLPSPSIATVFFTLSSRTRSSGDGKPLTITSATKQVQLQANFRSTGYTDYGAVLKNLSDDEIRRWTDLKPLIRQNIATVVLSLPADLLSTEDYILTLTGATISGAEEVIEEFAFNVVKK